MFYFLFLLGIFLLFEIIRGYLTAKNKKRYFFKTTGGLLLITIFLFLFGPFFIISPIKIGYPALEKDNLSVYYPATQLNLGNEILERSVKAYQVNEKFYRTSRKMKILVASSKLDMLRFGAPPDAGGAGNFLGVVARDYKASENVLTHEMSHIYLAFLIGSPFKIVPRWFDEGLASYLGKMDYYKNFADLKIDLENSSYKMDLLNWQGLTGKIKWLKTIFVDHQAPQIYGQSYLMIKYLFDKYGEEKVYQFVLSLKNNSFDWSFEKNFGISIEEFHLNFVDFLENYSEN